MPLLSSVTIANGVTSDPVPLVVGMATSTAFVPNLGNLNTRFLISIKRSANSPNFTIGCS